MSACIITIGVAFSIKTDPLMCWYIYLKSNWFRYKMAINYQYPVYLSCLIYIDFSRKSLRAGGGTCVLMNEKCTWMYMSS